MSISLSLRVCRIQFLKSLLDNHQPRLFCKLKPWKQELWQSPALSHVLSQRASKGQSHLSFYVLLLAHHSIPSLIRRSFALTSPQRPLPNKTANYVGYNIAIFNFNAIISSATVYRCAKIFPPFDC